MIVDASAMPSRMAREAFFLSILRSDAMRAPVQPPVPGSGIPTKSVRPRNSAFWIPSDLPRALASSFLTIPPKCFVGRSQSKIFSIKKRMNGIGRILPIAEKNLLDKKENERNRQNIADRRKEQRLPQGQHKKTRKRNAAAQFNERQHRDQRHEKLRGQKAQICLKPINYYLQI